MGGLSHLRRRSRRRVTGVTRLGASLAGTLTRLARASPIVTSAVAHRLVLRSRNRMQPHALGIARTARLGASLAVALPHFTRAGSVVASTVTLRLVARARDLVDAHGSLLALAEFGQT